MLKFSIVSFVYFHLFIHISEEILIIQNYHIKLIQQNDAVVEEKYDVIIIGAGIAGITAATLLLQNNVNNVLILEGSDKIGGRVSTTSFGGSLIDNGAQWVLGNKGNIVYELSEPYNVLQYDGDDEKYDIRPTLNSGVNMTQLYEINEMLYDAFDDRILMSKHNGSMADFLNLRFEEVVKKLGIVDKNTTEATKDLLTKLANAFVGSDSLTEAGVLGFSKYLDLGVNDTYSWKTGFSTLIDILLIKYAGKNFDKLLLNKIKYKKVVQNINWIDGDNVAVTCEDGSKYFGNHVITTVSLGVLKHMAKFMFTPPLPPKKLAAIQSLGMGTVEKIFLQFSTTWWDKNGLDFSFVWTNKEKEEYINQSTCGGWPTEILGFHSNQNAPNILQGWIVGESAREMENFSDNIILNKCHDILKRFLPEFNITAPVNITRTDWSSNHFFRGSYSYATVKSDKYNLSPTDLAEPIHNKQNIPVILFAGEATHEKFYATVHGALESGWREALRILKIKNIILNI